jgi:hypothetical protein
VPARETADRFRGFARTEASALPVYTRLVSASAEDIDLMQLMESAPRGQRRPNLLLASVHDLLLSGVDHPLARWYPSISGEPVRDGDPFPAFRDLIWSNADRVTADLKTRATQTNEPNRSCLWRVMLPMVARRGPAAPIALVELGPSAGLNLCFDRYTYDFADGGDSLMSCQLRGAVESIDFDADAAVATRVGLDLSPIDAADDVAVRWLKACIWPEQLDRHARFDAAVSIVAADPPDLRQGDLIDDLPGLFDEIDADHHVVVINSWVLFYVERSRRIELEQTLGHHASAFAGMSWISAEGPGVVGWAGEPDDFLEEPHSVVGWTHWRSRKLVEQQVIARCHSHLAWLEPATVT